MAHRAQWLAFITLCSPDGVAPIPAMHCTFEFLSDNSYSTSGALLLTPRSGGVERERIVPTYLRSDGRIDIGSFDGSPIERSKGVER
jgi:hypothetical protein